eukprot:Phypoly_transcript_16357.p1 GENE.Phypoly_transcript_16357~~Phypoly_transcript_16357.p1  ORF type:complete len:139 (+),score=19.27 Phypoly_transcript_16357:235-651(+)
MKNHHRTSCRVVINPIYGNEDAKLIIASRETQLAKKRRMKEIVEQIERDFEDMESQLIGKTPEITPANTQPKPSRLSLIRTKRKGDEPTDDPLAELTKSQRDVVESRLSGKSSKWLKFMRSSEVSKSVLSACSIDDIK